MDDPKELEYILQERERLETLGAAVYLVIAGIVVFGPFAAVDQNSSPILVWSSAIYYGGLAIFTFWNLKTLGYEKCFNPGRGGGLPGLIAGLAVASVAAAAVNVAMVAMIGISFIGGTIAILLFPICWLFRAWTGLYESFLPASPTLSQSADSPKPDLAKTAKSQGRKITKHSSKNKS